jgi:capsule polysaccharide export protein KpsE/RkpR
MHDENYVGAILEEVRSQNKAVLEAVADIRQKVEPITAMQDDIAILKQDMRAVKAAVTETNHDISSLKARVESLETTG